MWGIKMKKLLLKFKREQTQANAIAVLKYLQKHPFSICLLDPKDLDFWIAKAQKYAIEI